MRHGGREGEEKSALISHFGGELWINSVIKDNRQGEWQKTEGGS